MRKPTKKLFLFGMILVFTMLKSCVNDDFQGQNNHHSHDIEGLVVHKVSFKEVLKNKEISEKVSMQSLGTSSNSNVLMKTNGNSNPVIDTTNVVYIQKGAYHSYTFRIINEQSEKVENLVLSLKEDGSYKEMLYRYNLTESDKESIRQGNLINYDEKLEIEEFNSRNTTNSLNRECWQSVDVVRVMGRKCASGKHEFGIIYEPPCDYSGQFAAQPPRTVITVTETCIEGGNDNGDNSGVETGNPINWNNPGNGFGGGNGNGNSNNTGNPNPDNPNNNQNPENPQTDFGDVMTTPLLEVNTSNKPCKKLKKLLEPYPKQNVKQDIDSLKNLYNTNTKVEHAYTYKMIYDGDDEVYGKVYSVGTSNSVNIEIGAEYYAAIHLHPKKSGVEGGVFSWSDIKTLKDMYLNSRDFNTENITILLVAPDPLDDTKTNTYAITVKDINLLTSHLNTDWEYPNVPIGTDISTDNKKLNAIHNQLAKKYRAGKSDLEKTFLEEFGHYGLSLFKLNSNDNWDELVINPMGNTKQTKSCN